MKEFFQKLFSFIKENPRIIFSLILVVFIPIAIFLNTTYTLGRFQKNIDTITHAKAILAENIINLTAKNLISSPADLQSLVEKIARENEEIKKLDILIPEQDKEGFKVIASNDSVLVGTNSQDLKNILAWNQQEGIANLGSDDSGRFWSITKTVNDDGGKKALVSLAFSLAASDNLVNSTINWSYLVVLLTIIIVLFLVSNQARLFGYALTLSKLKEIDKMKDNFISMASHELRSPLAAIKGYLEFFREKNDKNVDSESRHYLENISSSASRLDSLVNDILEVSRLEDNRIPMNIAVIDPIPIIIESAEEIKSEAMKKGLALNFLPASLPRIKADPERLKQILINLLSNSIKYTLSGKIEIYAKTRGKEMLITVADTGIGISSEDQANLFQKFFKIQNEQTKDIVSTGLGLWIAADLAEKMKGKVTVESIEGVGSHFTVHLPLA
jgi:signal transduction histidine kinase